VIAIRDVTRLWRILGFEVMADPVECANDSSDGQDYLVKLRLDLFSELVRVPQTCSQRSVHQSPYSPIVTP
jgi:hypothetical protein